MPVTPSPWKTLKRWPQSPVMSKSQNVYERFLIPFWHRLSYFSCSSVDSSYVSLQHHC